MIGSLLLIARRRKQRRKQSSKGVSTIGWAESQIEQDLRARDNRNESAGGELR